VAKDRSMIRGGHVLSRDSAIGALERGEARWSAGATTGTARRVHRRATVRPRPAPSMTFPRGTGSICGRPTQSSRPSRPCGFATKERRAQAAATPAWQWSSSLPSTPNVTGASSTDISSSRMCWPDDASSTVSSTPPTGTLPDLPHPSPIPNFLAYLLRRSAMPLLIRTSSHNGTIVSGGI